MGFKRVITRQFGPADFLRVAEQKHLPEPESGEIRLAAAVKKVRQWNGSSL